MSVRAGILAVVIVAAAFQAAMPGVRWIALGVAAAAGGLLAWLVVREGRYAATERARAEQLRRLNADLEARLVAGLAEARASSERLRSIIDSAVDAIVVIDQHGRVESFNPAAERLFGYARPEVIGRNVTVLMPPPYRDEHDAYLRRYMETGDARIIGIGREVTGRRRDGSLFPVHLSVGEMVIDGEKKFTGILHDLSARVALEQRLREGAGLAKIGEMAAVIAHEVKNPLAGIRGAIEVIGGRLGPNSREAAVAREIVTRIDALDGLIKDLLVFARPPQLRPALVDVVPLVTATAALMRQDPSLKDVVVDVAGTAPPIFADAGMLKIVLQNLLVNSAHAMQRRGRVDVTVANVDGTCEIAVSDTGPGIPAEIRDRVFDAFFTTKTRGSGLGLATAKRLVDAHHGGIAIECPPTGGTRVTVRLPAADRPAETSSGGSPV